LFTLLRIPSPILAPIEWMLAMSRWRLAGAVHPAAASAPGSGSDHLPSRSSCAGGGV